MRTKTFNLAMSSGPIEISSTISNMILGLSILSVDQWFAILPCAYKSHGRACERWSFHFCAYKERLCRQQNFSFHLIGHELEHRKIHFLHKDGSETVTMKGLLRTTEPGYWTFSFLCLCVCVCISTDWKFFHFQWCCCWLHRLCAFAPHKSTVGPPMKLKSKRNTIMATDDPDVNSEPNMNVVGATIGIRNGIGCAQKRVQFHMSVEPNWCIKIDDSVAFIGRPGYGHHHSIQSPMPNCLHAPPERVKGNNVNV